uniref:G domain-containing protein n=1 Tax=Panagrolaimus sp. PS1159 TaxID=55785 RepID=A0AC35FBY3_9BILA
MEAEAAKNEKSIVEKKTANILFIGQSGAGKSLLVNSIYNYLTYDFEEVSNAQTVDCILPCHFQLQTPDFQNVLFTAGPQDANEHFNDNGESVTQKPKIYNLKTEKYNCKVIDTPGLGDTRGAKQDAENVDLIRNAIIEIEELHAICFVMPSNILKR